MKDIELVVVVVVGCFVGLVIELVVFFWLKASVEAF